MAYFLFNAVARGEPDAAGVRALAVDSLAVGMWGVEPKGRHADALEVGDLAVIYLGAPDHVFIACAQLATPVNRWTAAEARRYPGDLAYGVILTNVEEWDPTVPMSAVLEEIGPSDKTKSDFPNPVVAIIATEYDAVLAVAARR
jgi:hypothetical protein